MLYLILLSKIQALPVNDQRLFLSLVDFETIATLRMLNHNLLSDLSDLSEGMAALAQSTELIECGDLSHQEIIQTVVDRIERITHDIQIKHTCKDPFLFHLALIAYMNIIQIKSKVYQISVSSDVLNEKSPYEAALYFHNTHSTFIRSIRFLPLNGLRKKPTMEIGLDLGKLLSL